MTTSQKFSVCAQVSPEQPPHSAITQKILAAKTMIAEAPFRAGDYEIHVFKAHDKKTTAATADDVIAASPLPGFGGLEADDMDAFKGPEERAEDARYSAQKSGRDVCVVAYDLNTHGVPFGTPTSLSADENHIYEVGAYEVHVRHPRGCNNKSLRAEQVNVQEVVGMTGAEDHEADNIMDFEDRRVAAERLFAAAPKDSATRAVAFYMGRWGVDQLQTTKAIAQQVNQKAGTPTWEEHMANLANKQSQPQPAPWFKRLWGAKP
ncbi:MAG TPA: hypothetical protein VGD95_04205 [Micavibrio sp.]